MTQAVSSKDYLQKLLQGPAGACGAALPRTEAADGMCIQPYLSTRLILPWLRKCPMPRAPGGHPAQAQEGGPLTPTGPCPQPWSVHLILLGQLLAFAFLPF